MQDDYPQHYRTSDLALAAALVSYGLILINVDASTLPRANFIFEHSDQASDIAEHFWQDNLDVNARTYFDAIKRLKYRLYEAKR